MKLADQQELPERRANAASAPRQQRWTIDGTIIDMDRLLCSSIIFRPYEAAEPERSPITCSVVIPSYQSASTITACLQAVLHQEGAPPYEVIVVDSSSDGTQAIIREDFPQVLLVARLERTLPGTARNLGVHHARGSIIAFLDSDCIPARDWLARIAAAHQAGHSVVGGAVLNGTPTSNVGCAGYIGEFREFLPQGAARQVAHIPTCNISYQASIFARHGHFPSAYYPQEDLLFNWLLGQRGEKLWFDPAIQVRHIHRTRRADFLAHQRRIGAVTVQVLRRASLPGSWLARRPALALSALPLIAALKFARTLRVFWRWRAASVWGQPLAWLLFALGLLSWAKGFGQALLDTPDAESSSAPAPALPAAPSAEPVPQGEGQVAFLLPSHIPPPR